MRYLSLGEVVELHRGIIAQSGGADGVREIGGLQSALAQLQMTFGGQQLYPTIESKAAPHLFFTRHESPICRW